MTGLVAAHRPVAAPGPHRRSRSRSCCRARRSAASLGLGTVLYALAIGPLTQLMLPAWIVELGASPSEAPSTRSTARVAMRVEASAATITSTVGEALVGEPLLAQRVDPAVGDRRPDLARGEVVEHDDAAVLDQVHHRVDADLGGLAGVEEQQRERALVQQRRPVGGDHLDLRVVGEDLGGRPGQLRVELGGDDPGLPPRTPERSQAVPTPQPVPNSAIVPARVAASVASSRPVSLRQNET